MSTPPPPNLFRRLAISFAVALLFSVLLDPFLSPPDAAAYFSWGWSTATNADFSFTNEFASFNFPFYSVWVTGADRVANDWPAGSGIVWAPLLALAAWIERALGISAPTASASATGEAARFLAVWKPGNLAVVAGLAWSTFLTLWAWAATVRHGAEVLLRGEAAAAERSEQVTLARRAAVIAGTAAFFGTPLFFYGFFGPFFSHALSFASVGLFLLLWDRARGRETFASATAAGIAAGWMMCIRPQSVLYGIVIPLEWTLRWVAARRAGDGTPARPSLPSIPVLGGYAAGFALGVAPLSITWWLLYGSPFALPKIEEMQWFSPHLLELFFSDFHGVLVWTPLLAAVVPGLWLLGRCDRALAICLAVAFALQVYVNAANEIWWASGSFGNRRLVDGTAIVVWSFAALTLALLRQWRMGGTRRRAGVAAAGALAALGCAWPLTLALAERLRIVTLDHYVPLNGDLLTRILQAPFAFSRIGRWLAENGIALGWGWRALLFMLLAAAVLWFISRNSNIMSVESDVPLANSPSPRRMLVVASGFLLLTAVCALRTPRFDPSWIAPLTVPRKSTGLWNNYLEKGHYLLHRGRFTDALDAFSHAATLRPGEATAPRFQAVALRELRRFREAADIFDTLLQANPRDDAALREARELTGSWTKAEPGNPEPWQRIAQWLRRTGREEEARVAEAEAQRLAARRGSPEGGSR